MPSLRFGVLGPLRVWSAGVPVPVPSGRRRAVLACLLANVGRPVAADTLIDAAWNDEGPDRPRAALNTVLSRLRALLGEQVLHPQPAGYVLDVPASAVDAHEFETLRDRAASAPPERAAALLDQALGLWRGRAYAEFADDGFAAVEAQRLELLRLEAIEERAARSVDEGAPGDAVVRLEALLAEQPFREHAVELLMTALYRAGRATDALARFRDFRDRLAGELGLDPAPALRDLEARILGHRVADPRPRAGPPLPAWHDTSTPFVGRESASADLMDAVAASPVVTVTGVGGVGKTRLVAQALPRLADELGLPVSVVELAAVRPGQVDAAVGEALGLADSTDTRRAGIVEYLSISDGLLVLDNCEHLLDEVAGLVAEVVRRCPRMRVLATSRRRLGLVAEQVLPLAPLTTPAPDVPAEQVALAPAVRLFADRVRRVRPTADPLGGDPADIARICRLLDGLPLALELVAPRVAALGAAPVMAQLVGGLPGHGRDELHGVVDWSYGLLTPAQRRLLDMLSVFAGDFEVAGVQEVAAAWSPELGPGDAVASLAELVEASLVSRRPDAGTTARYRLLEVVRAFASDRLGEGTEAASACLAHARWVRGVVERAARDHVGPPGVGAFEPVELLRGDIELAVRRSLGVGDLALAGAITGAVELCRQWPVHRQLGDLITAVAEECVPDARLPALPVAAGACVLAERGDLGRSRELAALALDRAAVPEERFLAQLALGVATIYAGEHDESARWWREIADADDLLPAQRAEGLISLALLAGYHDEAEAAQAAADAALVSAELAGSPALQAFARYVTGEIEARSDLETAVGTFALAAAEADRADAAHVGRVAGLARFAGLVRLGRTDEAPELVLHLLHDARRAGAWPQLWTSMRILAELFAGEGRASDAALLLAAADASDSAPPVTGEDVGRYAELDRALRTRLGGRVVDRIGELAAGLPRTQVLDRALALLAASEE